MKKAILLLIMAIGIGLHAQIASPPIAGTRSDINYLGSSYLAPFSDAMAFGLSQGWYNTAKVKKTLRFELGFTPSLVLVPSEFRSFTIDPNELQALELVNPNINESSTVFGDDSPGPQLRYRDANIQNFSESTFNMPAGLGFAVAPIMALNAGIGLPFDFELSMRYLPNSGIPFIEGSNIDLWGLGLKHDLLRYVPGEKVIPFSLAAFVSYSQMNIGQDFEPGANNDKRMDLSTNALVTRLLISKKILFITVYGGLGYNYLDGSFKISGTYDYLDPSQPLNPQQSIEDPIDLNSTEGSGWAANLGLRVKFLMLGYVSADYTFGPYNAANLSLGVSWDL